MADDVQHPVGEPDEIVVKGGRRLAVKASAWLDDWYTSHSPRNDNANAEGPWVEWVALARGILAVEEGRAKAESAACTSEKP